jgi:LysM repeat protein
VENKKKQSLSSFSKQYELNVDDLLVVNNFSADNLITPGIEIFLPYYDITKNKNE